ncbi:3-deoxy-D-manno-octulosonic acid transferase [Pedobacter frigoris]|uniref:3-deoxy-D-manno-octulosonic acid transferase n=1 Tax=Pedobacter frigoris TaxID=2571272 RepID=A0A4U1CEB1_9SPHI|nr:glycosyltransferase N-terminal domain-containing protein [Pedobacter frigoris]TKC04458.1 3-deoxy-D-manno-octulosonic acid transferase [Pedobacter frigoris]
MLLLYNIGIQFYGIVVRIFSMFNSKASFFIKGRTNIFEKIRNQLDASSSYIWFHFASLGEFEQGRPVLEAIKEKHPQKRIVITFFSPSGYEIRKNYPLADGVFYLPLDTPSNAKKLIALFNPELAVFTKYEYWFHYFKALNDRNIPIFIISGIFRPKQVFFKWYGGFNRKILRFVNHFFVQNEESLELLSSVGIKDVSISGDTRFDRVSQNAADPKDIPAIQNFCSTSKVFIAGSTWPPDEQLLSKLVLQHPDWTFIIAPHEIDNAHILEIQKLIPEAIRYTEMPANPEKSQVLIVDNIGLLSSIYRYGDIVYIGGGFGVGIHNTLEAAAFGIPVIFGPKYDKFQEAKDLISIGAASSISNFEELDNAFEKLIANNAAERAKKYVMSKIGSTDQILTHISKYF